MRKLTACPPRHARREWEYTVCHLKSVIQQARPRPGQYLIMFYRGRRLGGGWSEVSRNFPSTTASTSLRRQISYRNDPQSGYNMTVPHVGNV